MLKKSSRSWQKGLCVSVNESQSKYHHETKEGENITHCINQIQWRSLYTSTTGTGKGNILHVDFKSSYTCESQSHTSDNWCFKTMCAYFSLSGDCSCTNYKQENSYKCSGRGTLVCGKCMCPAPYVGSQCETNIERALSDDSRCRADANSPVCSNNGVCVDGFCECEMRFNPQERYSGQFCECSNFQCERTNNR